MINAFFFNLAVHVPKLQRLCPNIAHINLSVPISINPSGLIDANANGPCVEILKVHFHYKLYPIFAYNAYQRKEGFSQNFVNVF